MFPTLLPEVIFILGLIIISIISNKSIIYILTGFIIIFMDLKDTTNGTETLIMFLFGFMMLYYGITKKD